MKPFSRSVLHSPAGIVFLCAIGTIGSVSALANQDPGVLVVAQPPGAGPPPTVQPPKPKDLAIKWEKPTAPAPFWLDAKETDTDTNVAEDKIREALSERGEVSFNGTPLSGVMKFFRNAYSIPIVIDEKELEDENITPDEPITIELPATSFRNSLSLILGPLGLTYVIDKECLIITSKKANWGAVRYYDLSYVLPDNGLVTEIISTIEAVISPDQWQSRGGSYCIKSVGSMLVVKADEETNFAIERMLRKVKTLPPANMKPRVLVDNPANKPVESKKAVEIGQGFPK